VTKSKVDYCVFGIDPTTRVIFMGDPAIFGSNTSTHDNAKNYVEDNTDNIAFMQNFAAWLTNAALWGVDFVNQ